MSVAVVPLATRMHGEEYCKDLVERYRRMLEGIFFTDIVFSSEDFDLSEIKKYDALILLFLTGGTSKMGFKIASEANKPIFLLAYGYHNSLGSALSCRVRLRKSGVFAQLLFSNTPEELSINHVVRGVEAYSSLRAAVFGLITDKGLSRKAERFMSKTGIKVVEISLKQVLEEAEAASSEEVINLAKSELGVEAPNENLVKCLRFFLGVKRAIEKSKVNAVTMECFDFIIEYGYTPCIAVALMNKYKIPFACEEDYYSLILMYISRQLTCYPGWIANPSGIDGDRVVFAHCTIDLSLVDRYEIVSHFESGKPCSIKGDLLQIEYTLARMSDESIQCYPIRVHSVSKWSSERCRTQCSVEIEGLSPLEFLEKASGNHHVFLPGRLCKHLKVIDWLFYCRWKAKR
ncbi:MAG: hypothetical protein DRJ63_05995 [Thermoprotei archaeon]|nr:MAG: hypothetical protein DRJ63_05995 [Thermoprotei archaeon]